MYKYKESYEINGKWPQLLITGEQVTNQNIINEILLATDSFFTEPTIYAGGNCKEFRRLYQEASGALYIQRFAKYLEEMDVSVQLGEYKTSLLYHVFEKARERVNYLDTSYVHNTQASSCFVYGPYGWFDVNGKIKYVDCIGKWPSTDSVYEDFVMIAERWPFIKLNATCMEVEVQPGLDDPNLKHPLFNIKVENGKAEIMDPDTSVHKIENMDEHFEIIDRTFPSFTEGSWGEIGITTPHALVIADIVKDHYRDILLSIPDKAIAKHLKKYIKQHGFI